MNPVTALFEDGPMAGTQLTIEDRRPRFEAFGALPFGAFHSQLIGLTYLETFWSERFRVSHYRLETSPETTGETQGLREAAEAVVSGATEDWSGLYALVERNHFDALREALDAAR